MLEGLHEAVVAVDEQQQGVDVDTLEHVEEGLVGQGRLAAHRPLPDGAPLLHTHEGVLAGQDASVDRLEACVDEVEQLLELLANRLGSHLQSMPGQQLGTTIEGRVIDQVIVEATKACAVAAVQIAGLEPVAQLPVEHEFVAVTDDRARGIKHVALRSCRDQSRRHCERRERLPVLEGLDHGRQRFQQRGVGRCPFPGRLHVSR